MKKQRFLSLVLVTAMLLTLIIPIGSPVYADEIEGSLNVIYLNGSIVAPGNGLSKEQAVKTVDDALTCLPTEGGKIMVCGDTNIDSDITIDKPVLITSTDSAILTVSKNICLEADVTFQDIIIEGNPGVVYAQGNTLTLDEGITGVDAGYGNYSFNAIYGGGDRKDIDCNSNIIIKSGSINNIYCGGSYASVNDNTNITVSGGEINAVYGGGYSGTVTGNTNITVSGGEISSLCGGSCGESSNVTGNTNIIINDGQIWRICGGGIADTVTEETHIIINGGQIGNVCGGGSMSSTVIGNTSIVINGGQIGDVCGGSSSSSNNVTGNTSIIINGGKMGALSGSGEYDDIPSTITVVNGIVPLIINCIKDASLLKVGDGTHFGSLLLTDKICMDKVMDVELKSGSTLFLKNRGSITGQFTGGGTLKMGKYGYFSIGGNAICETVLEVSPYTKKNTEILTVKHDVSNGNFINERCTKTSSEEIDTYTVATAGVNYWTNVGNYDSDLTFSEDTITISNPNELAAVAKAVNEENQNFSGKTIVLSKDIDLSGYLWEPIGMDEAHEFKGDFDGSGHVVSNMNIMGEYEAAGLFGFVKGSSAEVHTLIQNVTVNGMISLDEFLKVGGIVGTGENITVQNCKNNTSITVSSDVRNRRLKHEVGGILGYGYGVVIDGCANQTGATILCTAATSIVGGIAGTIEGGVIYNTTNQGSVNGIKTITNKKSGCFAIIVGGIAGSAFNVNVNNCYNIGTVTASGGEEQAAAGICGIIVIEKDSDSDIFEIKNCYNAGKVTAFYAGGIAGIMMSEEENMVENDYYLDSSAQFSYYFGEEEVDPRLITDASQTSDEMQAVAFLDKLNGWVINNSTTSAINLGGLGLDGFNIKEWKKIEGINMGYPVFVDDPRSSSNDNTSGGGSHKSGSTKPVISPNTGVNVIVNGNNLNAGIVLDTKVEGKTITTITVDEKKLEQQLLKEGNHAVLTIPVKTGSDILIGELNGQMVKNMENKKATIELKTDVAEYTLPAKQIDIGAVSEQVGKNVELKDIKVTIEISKPTQETVKIVENSAKTGEFTIVVPPVEFSVKCTYGIKTVEVSNFNAYVERTVAIPEGIDPSKITTGVVIDTDGIVRHVPTKIIVVDGKYYAKINSLTNSIYSVIWHPVEFKDIQKHWAKDAIDNMGSRMVISGIGNNSFEPDRDITRAEFAAIMVRALGLNLGIGNHSFKDVKDSDWYCDYIRTAYEYKIISGYSVDQFGPSDKITREQAMTMIVKAMDITGLNVEFKADEVENLFAEYVDSKQSSAWARDNIATCVKSGIVSGKSGKTLAPKDEITRAEVAVIVERLLWKSNLI